LIVLYIFRKCKFCRFRFSAQLLKFQDYSKESKAEHSDNTFEANTKENLNFGDRANNRSTTELKKQRFYSPLFLLFNVENLFIQLKLWNSEKNVEKNR